MYTKSVKPRHIYIYIYTYAFIQTSSLKWESPLIQGGEIWYFCVYVSILQTILPHIIHKCSGLWVSYLQESSDAERLKSRNWTSTPCNPGSRWIKDQNNLHELHWHPWKLTTENKRLDTPKTFFFLEKVTPLKTWQVFGICVSFQGVNTHTKCHLWWLRSPGDGYRVEGEDEEVAICWRLSYC